jgi:hypothetical protein
MFIFHKSQSKEEDLCLETLPLKSIELWRNRVKSSIPGPSLQDGVAKLEILYSKIVDELVSEHACFSDGGILALSRSKNTHIDIYKKYRDKERFLGGYRVDYRTGQIYVFFDKVWERHKFYLPNDEEISLTYFIDHFAVS